MSAKCQLAGHEPWRDLGHQNSLLGCWVRICLRAWGMDIWVLPNQVIRKSVPLVSRACASEISLDYARFMF